MLRLLQEVCVGGLFIGFYVNTIYSPKLPWFSKVVSKVVH